MAKTAKYSDDLLLEAVIKYADVHPGKINIVDLTKWAKENIPGLEEVSRFMFMRQRVVYDKRGVPKKENRPCMDRIEEINKARGAEVRSRRNVLLTSSNMDDFFEYPKVEQRKMIAETRDYIKTLTSRIASLERENKTIRVDFGKSSDVCELEARIDDIAVRLKKMETFAKRLNKAMDERYRRAALASIGVVDKNFDFEKNTESLIEDMNEAVTFADMIKHGKREIPKDLTTDDIWGDLSSD